MENALHFNNVRFVGNTDISTRFRETSGLPVIRQVRANVSAKHASAYTLSVNNVLETHYSPAEVLEALDRNAFLSAHSSIDTCAYS